MDIMAALRNVDGLLIGATSDKPIANSLPVENNDSIPGQSNANDVMENSTDSNISVQTAQEGQAPTPVSIAQESHTITPPVQHQENTPTIDEYGNPLAKPKLYTEEEVQQIVQRRVKNLHDPQSQRSAEVNTQRHDGFQHDPNSSETWEQQLEAFVERTIEKRQQKIAEQQWKQQEAQRQATFEAKFTADMNKYPDFHQVVAGKPITDSMMLAARNLENPASFIYGAAKMHPQDLDRISRITDPYQQAAEVGRLHEKMVKSRAQVSNSPRPIESMKGDMPPVKSQMMSIDERIDQHAQQKRR